MQQIRQTISVFYSTNCRIFLPSIYSVQIDILQKKKNKTLTLNLFVSHAYALNTSASKSTEALSLMYYEKKKIYLEHSVEFQEFPSPQEDNDHRRILSHKTGLPSSRHGPNLTIA